MARRTILITWSAFVGIISIMVGLGLPLPVRVKAQLDCAEYVQRLKRQVDAVPGRHLIPRLDVTYKLCVDRMVAVADRKDPHG